jgi:IclR family mhp operon transcriptional activator
VRREEDDIRSLRHGIDALRLAAGRDGISTKEVTEGCRLSRAAAFRVLQTLCEAGYLLRSGRGKRVRYQLAQRVRELSDGHDATALVLEAAMPLMTEWTRVHGWPLAISIPVLDQAIRRFATDQVAARALVRYRTTPERMSGLMSASGLLCLAHQAPEIQAAALRSLQRTPLPSYAQARSPEEIVAMLERVHRDGYVAFRPIGHREASLAVPVWFDGTMTACIALRYMLVSEGGAAGHALRLKMLRSLCDQVAIEAQSRKRSLLADAAARMPVSAHAGRATTRSAGA